MTTDPWAAGYAAAKRFDGDTAPIALNKIRERLDDWGLEWDAESIAGTPIGHLIDDLTDILDNATEPRQ